jgi:hypothetical protein
LIATPYGGTTATWSGTSGSTDSTISTTTGSFGSSTSDALREARKLEAERLWYQRWNALADLWCLLLWHTGCFTWNDNPNTGFLLAVGTDQKRLALMSRSSTCKAHAPGGARQRP